MPSTRLPEFTRGDTFSYEFTLSSGWSGATFSQVKFTIRRAIPASSVTTDAGAAGQVTKTGGGITFTGGDPDVGTVVIAPSVTNTWEATRHEWDLQGTTAGGTVYTIDQGEIEVVGDVTRVA